MSQVIVTEPTLLAGLPDDVYHGGRVRTPGPQTSQSALKLLIKPSTPREFQWRLLNPEGPKRVFDVGRAAHTLVLGAGDPFTCCPADLLSVDGRMITTRAKDWASDQRAGGRTPLTPTDYDAVHRMAAAILAHGRAAELFTDPARRPEVSAFCEIAPGLWLRSRFDLLGGELTDFKGLALDTPIPTPTGWTTMADLVVGDQVFDAHGIPCAVTAKSEVHHRPCYRLQFDDNSTVICDDEHRWATVSGRKTEERRVLTAKEIAETLFLGGQRQHRVLVADALDLPEAALPIDPYLLGAWLGDGDSRAGRITKDDGDLFDLIAARGYEVAPIPTNLKHKRTPTRTIYGLTVQLRATGLLGSKHVPAAYLRASASQRLDLLRGLFDTDGTWNRARKAAVFSTVSKELAGQVLELALSLGQRATMSAFTARGYGVVRTAYNVQFRPRGINPFAMPRKANRVEHPDATMTKRRVIMAAEPVPTVPTQCITVDSPDSTYLCTRAMIPTHNTAADPHPDAFRRSAWNYGYHVQDVAYRRAWERIEGVSADPMTFVVVGKEPPHLVSICTLGPEFERFGNEQLDAALNCYLQQLDKHGPPDGEGVIWDGLPETTAVLSPPRTAYYDAEGVDYEPTF